ncbi:hypothetical protein ACJIZ3_004112 [Penstemon smallii]|uniref:Uncharacterized protein n=1 Tax=Penstemon smallii TaxID=265156 RepID=A0ABD3S198_9LAMI
MAPNKSKSTAAFTPILLTHHSFSVHHQPPRIAAPF